MTRKHPGRPETVDTKGAHCLNCGGPLKVTFRSYGQNYATESCNACGIRIQWPSKSAYLTRTGKPAPGENHKGQEPSSQTSPPVPAPQPAQAAPQPLHIPKGSYLMR